MSNTFMNTIPTIKILFLILSCYLFTTCSTKQNWGNILWHNASDNFDLEDNFPNEDAVILLDKGELFINRNEGFSYSTLSNHRIIKINNQRGASFANISIPYSSSTDISEIQARTIKPDGHILSVSSDDIYDVNLYPFFIFYSDVRAKRITMPGIEDGCIIEYKWKKTVKNFTYWDRWTFQHSIPTAISRYTVHVPSDWTFNWKNQKCNVKPKTTILPDGFLQTYSWELNNIGPLIPEIGMPPTSRVAKSILFSPYGLDSWDKIKSWYRDLAVNRGLSSDKIKMFTNQLVLGSHSDYEKLNKIYDFVRDKIRYISISIGIGGYQPHFAEDILINRYGDCKDKATLIKAMANSQNINVDLVLISTHQNGKVDTSFASHIQFNHVIARAVVNDSLEIWMDATETFCPFDDLPYYDKNRNVIVVDNEKKHTWFQTPHSSSQENEIRNFWEITLKEKGNIVGRLKMAIKGSQALKIRKNIYHLKGDQKESHFAKMIIHKFPNAQIDSLKLINLDNFELPLKINILFNQILLNPENHFKSFSISKFSSQILNDILFESTRIHPIEFENPFTTVDIIEINLNDHRLLQSPQSSKYLLDKMAYNMAIDSSKNKLKIWREFTLSSSTVKPEDYTSFQKMWHHISAVETQKIVLAKD